MRALLLPLSLLCVVDLARSAPAAPESFAPVFELAGVSLLCEQAEPLVLRGLTPAQQRPVGQTFAAAALCDDLARQLANDFDAAALKQVKDTLDSALAQRFTAAERAVGEDGGEALAQYRAQLAERPARQVRLELVRRLDKAAHTTALAALLRYEVGKTQALLALKARGERLDEQALSTQTAQQAAVLQQSSASAVESFMLYAYRQMPSEDLAAYAALYESPAVARLLTRSTEALPGLFAERRKAIRAAAAR